MGTDKKKLQGTIINETESDTLNQKDCLMGLLKSLIEEQKILPQTESEKLSPEKILEHQL